MPVEVCCSRDESCLRDSTTKTVGNGQFAVLMWIHLASNGLTSMTLQTIYLVLPLVIGTIRAIYKILLNITTGKFPDFGGTSIVDFQRECVRIR